jgi:hypothetical protein
MAKTVPTDENGLIVVESKQINIVKYHRMIGHSSLDITKKIAARLGIKLLDQMKSCEDCILAKIKRKNLNKVSLTKSKIPGERLLLDVSYIKGQSLGGRNMWLLIEDQASNMKWRFFMRHKNEINEIFIHFIKNSKPIITP